MCDCSGRWLLAGMPALRLALRQRRWLGQLFPHRDWWARMWMGLPGFVWVRFLLVCDCFGRLLLVGMVTLRWWNVSGWVASVDPSLMCLALRQRRWPGQLFLHRPG